MKFMIILVMVLRATLCEFAVYAMLFIYLF